MTPTLVDPDDWAGASPAIDDVRQRCVEHDGQDPLDEATARDLRLKRTVGARLWVAGDLGFALSHGTSIDVAVAPEARGRGHGQVLCETALATTSPVTAWSHGDHPAAARLAARHGFTRARELWVERRPADLPLPEALPRDGVRIRGFEQRDREAIVDINARAFADHPEQGAMDLAQLDERMAEPWFDPAGLLLAEDAEGRALGFHWTKQHDADHGEVYVIGLHPDAQGLGLGTVLTGAGLEHLHGRGVREVLLYVESDNAPARRLYERLGFTHDPRDTHVQYRAVHADPRLS